MKAPLDAPGELLRPGRVVNIVGTDTLDCSIDLGVGVFSRQRLCVTGVADLSLDHLDVEGLVAEWLQAGDVKTHGPPNMVWVRLPQPGERDDWGRWPAEVWRENESLAVHLRRVVNGEYKELTFRDFR